VQDYERLMNKVAKAGVNGAAGLSPVPARAMAEYCIPRMGRTSENRSLRAARRIAHGRTGIVVDFLRYAAETRQESLVLFDPIDYSDIERVLGSMPGRHAYGKTQIAGNSVGFVLRLREESEVGATLASVNSASDVRAVTDWEYDLQGTGAVRRRKVPLGFEDVAMMCNAAVEIGANRGRSR
jgi:hypothetical protein